MQEGRASFPVCLPIAPVDLNAEANHRRLMAGSIGCLNIREKSDKQSLRGFKAQQIQKPIQTRDVSNDAAMQGDDHDNGFLADNPFELADDAQSRNHLAVVKGFD